MSSLHSFVYRSRAEACDQLISFLRNPTPIDRSAPRPVDPLDRPVREYAAVSALASLAGDARVPALRELAGNTALSFHARSLLAKYLSRHGALDRACHAKLIAESHARCRALKSSDPRFDGEALGLTGLLACGDSDRATDLLSSTRIDIRVAALVSFAEWDVLDGREFAGAVVDRFEERFWVSDRAELDAVAGEHPSRVRGAHEIVERYVIATADRSARSREWLFDAWARAVEPDAGRLLEHACEQRGFVEFVARDPNRLDRTARAFDLPARAAVEVIGTDGFVRLVREAVRRAWTLEFERNWSEIERASRAARSLSELGTGTTIASQLLADFCARPRESVRGGDDSGLVDALVGVLWARDRAGTVALARSAAMRTIGGAVVRRAVLSRMARDPKPEDRDEAWRAMRDGATTDERFDGLTILEALGEQGVGWIDAVRSVTVDGDEKLAALRARVLARAGDRSAESDLVRLAKGPSVRAAVIALDALAPNAHEHRALFEWVLNSDTRADCPCCWDLMFAALRGYEAIVDDDANSVLFRALLRPEHDEVRERIAQLWCSR